MGKKAFSPRALRGFDSLNSLLYFVRRLILLSSLVCCSPPFFLRTKIGAGRWADLGAGSRARQHACRDSSRGAREKISRCRGTLGWSSCFGAWLLGRKSQPARAARQPQQSAGTVLVWSAEQQGTDLARRGQRSSAQHKHPGGSQSRRVRAALSGSRAKGRAAQGQQHAR